MRGLIFLSVLLLATTGSFSEERTENPSEPSRFTIYGTEYEKYHWLTDRDQRKTVLDFAVRSRSPELDQFILSSVLEYTASNTIYLEEKQKNYLLFAASRSGNVDTLAKVIELYSFTAKDLNNVNLLPQSLAYGSVSIVQYLFDTYPSQLDTTPFFNSRNDELRRYFENISALQLAACHGNTDVVRYLIEERKMDPNETNRYGHDIFDYAFFGWGSAETVAYLASKRDIDLTKKDDLGRTPLLKAASKGNTAIIKYLIETQHADPYVTDNEEQNIFQLVRGTALRYLIDKYDPINGAAAKKALDDLDQAYDQLLSRPVEEREDANNQLWLAQKKLDEAVAQLSFR